jgi:hypothetical protein
MNIFLAFIKRLKVMRLFFMSRKGTANISVAENPRSLKCKKAFLLDLMTLTFGYPKYTPHSK